MAILKEYYEAIREVKEDAFVVLEHFCDTREETELAQAGLHLWRNMNNAYCQSAMGWEDQSAFTSLYEKEPAWVGYMESHDEERVSYKQKTYGNYDFKTNLATRMDQLEVNASFFLTVPGPKMVWQFGEMGYDVSIEENGRTGRKPLHWEYLEDADRKSLHDTYVHLAELRNAAPELFDATGPFTWKVAVTNWANGRILYSESVTGKKLMVMGNFTNAAINVSLPTTVVRSFPKTLFAYMIGEANMATGSVHFGYDVTLNQMARGIIAERCGIVDFPYTFVGKDTLERIMRQYTGCQPDKKGIFMEINSTTERPVTKAPAHFKPLMDAGYEIILHKQKIYDNLLSIYNAKYFVKMGGRTIRGNSVAEAVSLGTLAIMDRDEVIHKELIIDECNVKTMEEMVNLINRLERSRSLYLDLLDKQRSALQHYFFDTPMTSLTNCLEDKRHRNGPAPYTWRHKISDRLCFLKIK